MTIDENRWKSLTRLPRNDDDDDDDDDVVLLQGPIMEADDP